MQVNVKQLYGKFDRGFALDKHTFYSIPKGENEHGHMQFDTKRSQVGEAVFLLKYRNDQSQARGLAQAVVSKIMPRLGPVSIVEPMPASTARVVQPVTQVAVIIGQLLGVSVSPSLLIKAPSGAKLKNLLTRADKDAALVGTITCNDILLGNGPSDILLVDDLYHTGASIDAACQALRSYAKIRRIYAAVLTWR